MTGRIIWRRAHPVRLPDRINTAPHLEMNEAWRREQFIAEGMARLEQELERKLSDEDERT